MAPRSKVHSLPPELKEWLDAELVRRGFGDYAQLAADLKARGADVSKSALHRYGSPFERTMARAKVATEQARALVDIAPDEEDKLSAAVIRITQEKILNLLMELDIDAEDVDVNKLFKNAAEIGKASVNQKRLTLEVRAKIEEAARKKALADAAKEVASSAKKQGLSADMVAQLREAIQAKL